MKHFVHKNFKIAKVEVAGSNPRFPLQKTDGPRSSTWPYFC